VPLLRAISRETTLLEGQGALGKVDKGVREIGQTVDKLLGKGGLKPSTTGAPGEQHREHRRRRVRQSAALRHSRPKAAGRRWTAWSTGCASCRTCSAPSTRP
jgi:hypothetical protein